MYSVSKDFHGREFSIESGRVAKQANGSVVVRSGDSVVLVTACMGDERDGDFLPLTIDYVEKTYAAGRIPGGFFKREGRLSEHEVLTSRLIDRPCRPLFPKGFRNEVQVIATVLSAEDEADTDVLALCGASAALTVSDVPFEGPVAGVRVARIGGKLVINPTHSQLEKADLNFLVAGTADAIVMVEGEAQEVAESEVLEALFYAHQELQTIIGLQLELQTQLGKTKIKFTPIVDDPTLVANITKFVDPEMRKAVVIKDKLERRDALRALKKAAKDKFITAESEQSNEALGTLERVFEHLNYTIVRELVFKSGQRIDGRDTKTVRPIDIELSILPRAHGSSLFTRGETQAIVSATLGVGRDAKIVDSLLQEEKKRFFLHYNFPPFSVGEVKMLRSPGRREIGHGTLAERALSAVLPSQSDWPYVLRIVSEITESNGSSSMATVCGGALAMMDAGIPIKAPVAGVAMGLMKEGDDCQILTDILGDEDHLGDMDFKVCGTSRGITALQMDIKIKGLDQDIMTNALAQAREGRLHILGKMDEALATPRKAVSKFAPKIIQMKINPDKIKDVIGPGGKTIRSLTESHDVSIDINDVGLVIIAGTDQDRLNMAKAVIESLTAEAEVGRIYQGIVKRVTDFGAFVEILPGLEGLCHISQLEEDKVRYVTDVCREGDEMPVKVLEVDRQGKIRLSRREALAELESKNR